MSDKQRLESIFRRRGICFEATENMIIIHVDPDDMTDCGGKVGGYANFSTEFYFNDAGDLSKVEVWG